VTGGISFSEMRCAYEVTSNVKNWEVIIGNYMNCFIYDFVFYHTYLICFGQVHHTFLHQKTSLKIYQL